MTAGSSDIQAVIFDFSGTLFRLDEDDSWFDGVTHGDGTPVDGHHAAELMRRLTAPVGEIVEFDDASRYAWRNRDLDPFCWTPYPDTAEVLKLLAAKSIPVAVLSNIAFDIRPAFDALGVSEYISEFVLSYEVGFVKPQLEIFRYATEKLGVVPSRTLMVGDSEEADGAARGIGCAFALVEPVHTSLRPDALRKALERNGI